MANSTHAMRRAIFDRDIVSTWEEPAPQGDHVGRPSGALRESEGTESVGDRRPHPRHRQADLCVCDPAWGDMIDRGVILNV